MHEIVPGVHHWTAYRDTIGMSVSSHWIAPAGVLIDPMVPDEGLEPFERAEVGPQQSCSPPAFIRATPSASPRRSRSRSARRGRRPTAEATG